MYKFFRICACLFLANEDSCFPLEELLELQYVLIRQ